MAAQETGLSLEGLAHQLGTLTEKLEGLQRENEQMRSENAELRGRMAALSAPEKYEGAEKGAPDHHFADEERVSRRALLAKAGAAVAAVAAGTLLTPREAKAAPTAFDDYVTVQTQNNTNNTDIGNPLYRASVYARNDAGGNGVTGAANDPSRAGVFGGNSQGDGVRGQGNDGVRGESTKDGFSGVYGTHFGSTVGPGVTGDGKGNWPGVWGRNPAADGVTGDTEGSGKSGVYGRHNGTSGFGVTGDGKGASGAGVLGRNAAGYGGQFEGGRAQLKLKPAGSTGRPGGAHTKGEVYMDSAANLFVCVRSGTPGTWRKVTTSAV